MAYDDPTVPDDLTALISGLLGNKTPEPAPISRPYGLFGSAANTAAAPAQNTIPTDAQAAPQDGGGPDQTMFSRPLSPLAVQPLQAPSINPPSAWDLIPRVMRGQTVSEAAADAHAENTARANQQSGYAPLPTRPVGGGIGNLIGNMLTNGWLEHEQDRTYQRQVANVQQRNLMTAIGRIQDPDEQQYAINDPQGWLKSKGSEFEARVLKGGESISSGHKGTLTTAPLLTNDNGRFVTQLPGSTTITGYSGPKVGANGVDERTGKVFPVASTPVVPNGSHIESVVSGGNATAQDPVIGSNGLGQLPGALPTSVPPPAVGPAAASPTAGLGPSNGIVPRGIRNGNPLNVRALPQGQNWLGQTGTDAAGYAQFSDPTMGIRAAQRNLTSYAKRDGINTVAGAISRWAPAGADGNATGPYIAHVAQALGVSPYAKVDLTDPAIQSKMIDAMGEVENGPQAYQAWKAAGSPAMGASAPPSNAPSTATPSPATTLPGGFTGGSASPLTPITRPHLLQPGDPRLKQFAPGQTVEEDAAGHLTPVEGTGYTPSVINSLREETVKDPAYSEYAGVVPLVKSMRQSFQSPSAAGDLNGIEAAARIFNPKATVRQGVMKAFEDTNGIPDMIIGALNQLNTGKGNARLSNDTRSAILQQAEQRAAQLRKSLQPVLDNKTAFAQRNGINPLDILPPVEELDTPPPARAAPKVGDTVNGYRYVGGDPHQRSSWVK